MPFYFDLYKLKYFGLWTLLPSASATTTLPTFESPLHFYPLTLQGDTLPVVIGLTKKWFYVSLADQFKILGSWSSIYVGKKRPQRTRKAQIPLPK